MALFEHLYFYLFPGAGFLFNFNKIDFMKDWILCYSVGPRYFLTQFSTAGEEQHTGVKVQCSYFLTELIDVEFLVSISRRK